MFNVTEPVVQVRSILTTVVVACPCRRFLTVSVVIASQRRVLQSPRQNPNPHVNTYNTPYDPKYVVDVHRRQDKKEGPDSPSALDSSSKQSRRPHLAKRLPRTVRSPHFGPRPLCRLSRAGGCGRSFRATVLHRQCFGFALLCWFVVVLGHPRAPRDCCDNLFQRLYIRNMRGWLFCTIERKPQTAMQMQPSEYKQHGVWNTGLFILAREREQPQQASAE